MKWKNCVVHHAKVLVVAGYMLLTLQTMVKISTHGSWEVVYFKTVLEV